MTAMPLAEQTVAASIERSGHRLTRTYALGESRTSAHVDLDAPLTGPPLLEWWRAYWSGKRPTSELDRGPLRVMELFCGAGGLALGVRQTAEELGYTMRSLLAADQDAQGVEVYARRNATSSPVSASVTELVDYRTKGRGADARFRYDPVALGPAANLPEKPDVLLAGPPCQGHSGLNNHSRRIDPRNELYLTVPALAVALDIPHVIIENVPGVVHDELGVVAMATSLFETAGYHVTGDVIRADELGWPQRRRRYFLVASRRHEPVNLAFLADTLRADETSVEEALAGFEATDRTSHMWRLSDLAPETQARLDWLVESDERDLDLSQRPDCHKDGTTYTAVYGRMYPDRPAPTITTGFMTMGRGRFVHHEEPRMITPAEAARLQGFPDDYDFHLASGEPPSTLKLTKWIGDAVPMPLGHAAALSVLLPQVLADAP